MVITEAKNIRHLHRYIEEKWSKIIVALSNLFLENTTFKHSELQNSRARVELDNFKL